MFLLVVFMYNQTLHRHRKHFSRYYLQFFGTAQILKRFVNYSLEFKYKKIVKMAKEGEVFKFKNYTRIIKSPSITYADFTKKSIMKKLSVIRITKVIMVAVLVITYKLVCVK